MRVAQVRHKLAVEAFNLKVVEPHRGGQLGIAGPAVLLVDRRIGNDVVRVVQKRSCAGLVNPVDQRVGTSEAPPDFHILMHNQGRDLPGIETRAEAGDFHVAKALMRKARLPDFFAITTTDVLIVLEMIALHMLLIADHLVVGAGFAINDADGGTGRFIHADTHVARHHVRELKHDAGVVGKDRARHRQLFYNTNRLELRRQQVTPWRLGLHAGLPVAVIEPTSHPALRLEAGIEPLPPVHRIAEDRAFCASPSGRIQRDAFAARMNIASKPEAAWSPPWRVLKSPDRHRIHIVSTAPQVECEDVLTLAEVVGDVIRGEVDPLVVIGKGGFKLTIPHPRSVDIQLVVTQAADIEACRIHRPAHRYRAPEDRVAARMLGIILLPGGGDPVWGCVCVQSCHSLR